MPKKETLFLCMGSACHQKGVVQVLPRLQALMAENNMDTVIEFKGAFCLGPCTDGIVLKFRDRHFLRVNAQNVDEKFYDEILPALREAAKGHNCD